eukprot:1742355-Amphidinium_carterae.1
MKTVVICTRTKQKAWKVWRAGRLCPLRIITRDFGVDTRWVSWSKPVQKKRIRTFQRSMTRVRPPIVKSLHNVGPFGAEVGGITAQGMSDLRTSARRAFGKGACLLMAHGGTSGASWPAKSPDLKRRLRLMTNRLGWVPDVGGWRAQGQWFPWDEADLRAKWDSAKVLCASSNPHFRRCGVGYVTDTGERDPERPQTATVRARNALFQSCQVHWIKAHQTQQAVEEVRVTMDDFQGNQEADVVVNLGAAEHAPHEPSTSSGQLSLRRSDAFGFWLDRSFVKDLKLGPVSG